MMVRIKQSSSEYSNGISKLLYFPIYILHFNVFFKYSMIEIFLLTKLWNYSILPKFFKTNGY